ncbi:unnamed protein product [Echinostoma caproni]|uniref:Cystatin domain-containing protein n=1 Tax=Echinostoma caproni TaxID=27848 RepID=A0A183AHS0_9TREM|nr:unnamed protein product [Echinostoma caproni]
MYARYIIKPQRLPVNYNPQNMNFNIVKIVFITFCVSGVLAAEAQSCKEVVATIEAKSIVVQSNVTGCQYRITSDSGKAVKVYVNSTSGTKCVTINSGGTSETLCPSGPKYLFTSKEPIEVSAESGATTTDASATEANTAQTSTPATETGKDSVKPKPAESEEGKKEGANPGTDGEHPPHNTGKEEQQPAKQEQPGNSNGAGDKQSPAGPQQESPEKGVQQGSALSSSQLVRRARDTSSTDVTVYYILGEFCKGAIMSYEAQ